MYPRKIDLCSVYRRASYEDISGNQIYHRAIYLAHVHTGEGGGGAPTYFRIKRQVIGDTRRCLNKFINAIKYTYNQINQALRVQQRIRVFIKVTQSQSLLKLVASWELVPVGSDINLLRWLSETKIIILKSRNYHSPPRDYAQTLFNQERFWHLTYLLIGPTAPARITPIYFCALKNRVILSHNFFQRCSRLIGCWAILPRASPDRNQT